MFIKNFNQLLSRLDGASKGGLAEAEAKSLWRLCGWEPFVPEPGNKQPKVDMICRNPLTYEMVTVQVKTISADKNGKRYIDTCSTGSGNRKGERRNKTHYADENITYIMGIDLNVDEYFLYNIEFYRKFERKFSVDKYPSIEIPLITETSEAIRIKRLKKSVATLDLI